MICVIGEYKKQTAEFFRKHLNKFWLLFEIFLFAAYTRIGIKGALKFNCCIVGNNGFNNSYLSGKKGRKERRKEGRREGRKEGGREGRKEGGREGRKEGRREGRKERPNCGFMFEDTDDVTLVTSSKCSQSYYSAALTETPASCYTCHTYHTLCVASSILILTPGSSVWESSSLNMQIRRAVHGTGTQLDRLGLACMAFLLQ
jgi:hypothetical protein